MLDNRIIYTLISDNREAGMALRDGKIQASKNCTVTMIIDILIEMFVLVVIMFVMIKLIGYVPVWFYITGIANFLMVMANNKKQTAARIRMTNATYIGTSIIDSFIGKLVIVRPIVTKNRLKSIILKEATMRFLKENKSWDQLDKQLTKNTDNDISAYWKERGMYNSKVDRTTSCITFRCVDPIIPSKHNQDYCYDMRETIDNDHPLTKLSKGWVASDISDEMHVKSIYKRLCPEKYPINTNTIYNMIDILDNLTIDFTAKNMTKEEKIKRALGTDGSPGQFSKRSQFEEIWKLKTSQISVDLWVQIVDHIFEIVYLTNNVDERFTQYMLYRKREAIAVDENNNPKPTRLMNAPNLVARICDSIAFTEYNDNIMESRFKTPASLGMNIFIELKMLLVYNPDYNYLVSDYKDYDGSQHPAQGYAMCLNRIKYMIKTESDVKLITYMLPRYNAHMYRTVKSTWGIEYDVIGQQASGDITTSDDNTEKTSALQVMIINEAIKRKLINVNKQKDFFSALESKEIGIDVTSDDTGIMYKSNNKEHELLNLCKEKTNEMGWAIKEGSVSYGQMLQNGENEYLSHSVVRKRFMTRNGEIIHFAVTTRKIPRYTGKSAIAAEMSKELGPINRAKLASKYLTQLMVSIGNPEMIMMAIYQLLLVRSASSDYKGSYSWSGIKACTIKDIDLNRMIELQAQTKFERRIDWIELTTEEIMTIIAIKNKIENQLITFKATYNIKNIDEINNLIVIKENKWWNVRSAIQYLVTITKALDKASYMTSPKETIKWWEEIDTSKIEKQNTKDKTDKSIDKIQKKKYGKILLCKHMDIYSELETTGIFDIKLKCEKCYLTDKELRDYIINIGYYRINTNDDEINKHE